METLSYFTADSTLGGRGEMGKGVWYLTSDQVQYMEREYEVLQRAIDEEDLELLRGYTQSVGYISVYGRQDIRASVSRYEAWIDYQNNNPQK